MEMEKLRQEHEEHIKDLARDLRHASEEEIRTLTEEHAHVKIISFILDVLTYRVFQCINSLLIYIKNS
jgi:hypothetical protein